MTKQQVRWELIVLSQNFRSFRGFLPLLSCRSFLLLWSCPRMASVFCDSSTDITCNVFRRGREKSLITFQMTRWRGKSLWEPPARIMLVKSERFRFSIAFFIQNVAATNGWRKCYRFLRSYLCFPAVLREWEQLERNMLASPRCSYIPWGVSPKISSPQFSLSLATRVKKEPSQIACSFCEMLQAAFVVFHILVWSFGPVVKEKPRNLTTFWVKKGAQKENTFGSRKMWVPVQTTNPLVVASLISERSSVAAGYQPR